MDRLQPQVSRRDMLRKAGTASVAAFTFVRPGAVRGSDANSAISVGLIGAGNRGTYDASIVHADPRARITALCDLFDDRIEAAIPKIKVENPAVYREFEKLLASNVDAVIIATPPFEHPRMLAAAVQAGKHVYCEKPAGVDLEGCKKVMATGRAADPKKCLWFGFQQRYGPLYLEAYKRLREGRIGELANARGFWIDTNPFQRVSYSDPKVDKLRNWFCYRDYSGDFIIEQDCHNLDMFHWFLGGLPLRAVGYGGKKVRADFEILDHLSLSFEFPDGIHVNFEANQLSPTGFKRVGEEFTGTKGVLATSRASLVHTKGPRDVETIPAKRDVTIDAFEAFLSRIQSGETVNMAEQSARSTMIGLLGRAALYQGREATWKGEFGSV
ncbi:MAG: Gfo/Idh/MocA family oxidoreductase [Bryobacteraceae bacterium]|jgi:predicted dehydrogenase